MPGDDARPGSLAAVIRDYRRQDKFRQLAPRTRDSYNETLDYLSRTLGDVAFAAITYAVVVAMAEEMAATPSKANQCLALISNLSKVARKQGLTEFNPASGVDRIPLRPRIQIWSREEEARRFAPFRPRVRLLAMLMLYTTQRMSDVLGLTTHHVVDHNNRLYIVVRQHKTEALVGLPVHANLEPLIRARLAEDVTITVSDDDGTKRQVKSTMLVPSPKGLFWQRRNAARAWDDDQAKADAELAETYKLLGWSEARIAADLRDRHRQRRDLRRTGIVRLAEAGATTPQIAAISGHSIDYCAKILDVYLPRRTEIALGGIEAWEVMERDGRAKVLRLPDAVVLADEALRRKERA